MNYNVEVLNIIKWYLLAVLISALSGIVLNAHYLFNFLSSEGEVILDLVIYIIMGIFYTKALLKTFSIIRKLPNK